MEQSDIPGLCNAWTVTGQFQGRRSLTAFLTPMATPAVPMCMADGGYDLRAIFKSGALITLILPFIYIFYTMTVFPAF
mgnify:CR=1 FL=1